MVKHLTLLQSLGSRRLRQCGRGFGLLAVSLAVSFGVMMCTVDAQAERRDPLQINIPSLPKNMAKVDVVDNNLALKLLDAQMGSQKILTEFPKEAAPASGQVTLGKRAKPLPRKVPKLNRAKRHKLHKPHKPRRVAAAKPAVVIADDNVTLASGPLGAGVPSVPSVPSVSSGANSSKTVLRVHAESYAGDSSAKSFLTQFSAFMPMQASSAEQAVAQAQQLATLTPAAGQPAQAYVQPQPLQAQPVAQSVTPIISPLEEPAQLKMVSPSVQAGLEVEDTPVHVSNAEDPRVADAAQQLSATLSQFDPFMADMPKFSQWEMQPPIKGASQATKAQPAQVAKVPNIIDKVQQQAKVARKQAVAESIDIAKAEVLATLEPASGASTASIVALSRDSQNMIAKVPSGIDSPKPARGKVDIDRETTSIIAYSELATEVEAEYESYGMQIELRRPVLDVNQELNHAYDAVVAGHNGAALETYNRVLKAQPGNMNALYGKATLLHQAGQIEEARGYYQRILSKDPDHREALNNFLSLVAEEAPQAALEELYMLQKKNPHFSPIPAQISNIYQKTGDYQSAISAMLDAHSLAPGNLTYTLNMAVLLDRAGAKPQATEYYQQLVDARMKGKEIPGNINVIQERLTFLRSNR